MRVDRRHTAYHEAGHAVIGHVLGYDVRKATIRKRYNSLGGAWVSKPSSLGATEVQAGSTERDDFGHICVDLAGPLAEKLVNRSSFKELIANGSSGDWETAQRRARRINRKQSGTVIDVLVEETKALVQHHRAAIARVAAALLERETVNGDDIKRLTNGSVS